MPHNFTDWPFMREQHPYGTKKDPRDKFGQPLVAGDKVLVHTKTHRGLQVLSGEFTPKAAYLCKNDGAALVYRSSFERLPRQSPQHSRLPTRPRSGPHNSPVTPLPPDRAQPSTPVGSLPSPDNRYRSSTGVAVVPLQLNAPANAPLQPTTNETANEPVERKLLTFAIPLYDITPPERKQLIETLTEALLFLRVSEEPR